MTKQANQIDSYASPETAMDAAITQYATGERARPVVATDGKKFFVCSKATAKTKDLEILTKLFKRPSRAGSEGVQQARKDAKAAKPSKAKTPEAGEFWDKLNTKQSAKRAARKAKLETIQTVNKAAAK